MALLILLDQMPRNMFRGTANMFASDSLALPLAKEMVNDDLTSVEKMFVFTAIQHAESLECAKMAEEGLKTLVKNMAGQKRQRKYMKLLPAAKSYITMLENFKRYPHLNSILGRVSTEQETKYLMTHNKKVLKSVNKPKPVSAATTTTTHTKPTVSLAGFESIRHIRPMRILLLHGFRQNATVIRDALKPMMKALKPYPIEFVSLSSPMIHTPGTTDFGVSKVAPHAHTSALPAEYLRCWWNASDDGKEYLGWESSVRFVQQASQGQSWDGIIAFSQGATLTSLLCAVSQVNFTRFAVLISGSPSRATAHQTLFHDTKTKEAKRIAGVKTLNIYGKQDTHLGTPEEMKERTAKLAERFEEAEILEHGGGHFTPQWWPWEKICEFILKQAVPLPDNFGLDGGNLYITMKDEDCVTVEERLQKLKEHAEMIKALDRQHSVDLRPPTVRTKALQNWIGKTLGDVNVNGTEERQGMKSKHGTLDEYYSILYDNWHHFCQDDADEINETFLDDLFVSSFYVYTVSTHTNRNYFQSMLAQLAVAVPDYTVKRFPLIVKYSSWEKLNDLVSIIWDLMIGDTQPKKSDHVLDTWKHWTITPTLQETARHLYKAILEYMGTTLRQDAAVITGQSNSLSGEEGEGNDFTQLSFLAKSIPRIKGSLDNQTHFARDLALWLRPMKFEADKLTAYVGYQKLVRSICKVLENASSELSNHTKGRELEKIPRLTLEERQAILAMPPNVFVATPEEVPVAPCPIQELQPLISYLSTNAPVPKENVKFVRGVVVPVKTSTGGSKGVLDLCKQVVGPEGVTSLLDGLSLCKGVEGLLLGNNVTGSRGAREIARYIRRPSSQITAWYLGGNQFGPEDVGVIFAALEKDSKVLAIWLKRNPVLPAGMQHIAKSLSVNRTLTTLDLSNCGLLDEGCITLFRTGMMHNRTMKHLYLNTNGITGVGTSVIAEYFEKGGNMESLYLSCNPLGDEPVKLLAQSLKGNRHLVRLGLASCAIGIVGITALVDTFPTLPKLEYLNLGFLKGTYIFNGLPNYLGYTGLELLCSVIPQMRSLRYLDINHNQIPPKGLHLLYLTLCSLPEGQGLTSLLAGQFGQHRSELVDLQLKDKLAQNKILWGKSVVGGTDEREWKRAGEELADRALCPDHVREIMSTTRNMN